MASELATTAPASSPPAASRTLSSPGDGRPRAGVAGLAPGMRLAHFRLVRPLGHGGMGEVWLAIDIALDREVALKLLPAARVDDPERRARLIREARAQARLHHPNVCHIYYVGEDAGRLFFAMERIRGETLAERIAHGPLAPVEALELVRMAALGLREAQQAGFIHRDVKPSNLMLDHHGNLKVMDFGLVGTSPDDAARADGHATATSAVGTPLYMAPEQARGEVVDERADIYALGATLHHLVAGRPPFGGDSLAELRSCHAEGTRPPLVATGGRRAVTRVIDELVARMMAKRREDRFAGYDDLIAALERASPVRTRPGGFWARGVATSIDALLAATVMVPLVLGLHVAVPGLDFVLMLVAYVAVVVRFGTTPGHALMDLVIVDHVSGRRPTATAAARRQLVLAGPFEVASQVHDLAGPLGVPALGLVGILAMIGIVLHLVAELAWASARTHDKRPLWDRVAGTQVRYRR